MEQIYGPNMLFEDLIYAFSIYTLRTNVSKTSLSPISDLERIFPYNHYNIKLTSDVEKRKIATRGLLVDPIPNYPHCHCENCIADNY